MAYNKTVWENDITPVSASNMNKIEDKIEGLDILTAPLASSANYTFTKVSSAVTLASGANQTFTFSLTSTGRPIFVIITGVWNGTAAGAWGQMTLKKGTTTLGTSVMVSHTASYNVPGVVCYLDIVPAGTYTYTAVYASGSGTGTYTEQMTDAPTLIAFEI